MRLGRWFDQKKTRISPLTKFRSSCDQFGKVRAYSNNEPLLVVLLLLAALSVQLAAPLIFMLQRRGTGALRLLP